ncbi:MAG: hypothetical protein WC878_04790 [Candidatus Paceibacterota bacterium]|jgi:hypothetical protein
MENFPIKMTGNPIEKEDRVILKDSVEEGIKFLHEEGKSPFPSEREKTEKEKKAIETSGALLSAMFDRFKIPHEQNIVSDGQIHFFTKEDFEKEFQHVSLDVGGFHDGMRNAICLKDGNEDAPEGEKEIFDISDMAHECIHLASRHSYQAIVGTDDSVVPFDYRVGYAMTTVTDGKPTRKFNGWNEGVVCITQNFLFSDFLEELEKRTGITKEMRQDSHYNRYAQNQDVVFDIAEAIGEYRKESPVRSMYRLIKGQFTGDMMPLRDIDDIFGKGSLDLLAEYKSVFGTKDDHRRDELIADYFRTNADDEEERKRIGAEIEKLKQPIKEKE